MSEPQKVILKVELNCEKCKQRALRTAAEIEGVTSVALEKDSKLVVIGNPDIVRLAQALRKYGYAELLSVGPAKDKEPAKPKKDAPKQDQPTSNKQIDSAAPPPLPPRQEFIVVVPSCTCFSDENPNACVIC